MASREWDKIVARRTALARMPEQVKKVLREAGPPLSDQLGASEIELELLQDELPVNLEELDREVADELEQEIRDQHQK